MGVLVIEAAQKSGTGITVNYARRQGKAIFCIPNSLENKKGEGTNRLLKRDGKLVTNANDILEYFNMKQIKQISIDEIEKQVDINPEYKKIYKLIQKGEIHLNSKLLMLELAGLVESKPGNNYEICRTIFK